MKVLISGGYGFIGSHVADKFFREGHEVFILDNLSSGSVDFVQFKHRHYEMSVEDSKLDDVFKSNRFDAVVHLAFQSDESFALKHPNTDAKMNVVGTINLLNCVKKHKVKRFVYISSDEVYGQSIAGPVAERAEKNPTTLSGLNKIVSETYCQRWQQQYGVNAVVLRVGQVYGPRMNQSNLPLGRWIKSELSGERWQCAYDPEQLISLVYVEDVAMAIFSATVYNVNETMNIGSDQAVKMGDLVKSFTDGHLEFGSEKVMGSGKILDFSAAKRNLDWYPMTDLRTGMTKTLEWYRDHVADERKKQQASLAQQEKQETRINWHGPLMQFVEAAAAFGIIFTYKLGYYGQHATEPFDLSLIFIVAFSIFYGARQGIIAVLLSASATILAHVLSGREPLMLLYQTDFYLKMAFYVFIGFLIGYIKDQNEHKIESNENQIDVLEEKLQFATLLYQDMREIRDELQVQIANSEDSFGKIFSIVQTLDSLRPDEIFARAVQVIEKLLKIKGVAIYRFSEGSPYARLMAVSQPLANKLSKSIKIADMVALESVKETKELFVSMEVGEGKPVMAMPVFEGQNMIGAIVLYQAAFERLTLSYQNYFKVVSQLIASSLSKAYAYDLAVQKERTIEATEVLKPDHFESLLSSKRLLKRDAGVAYALLEVNEPLKSLKVISDSVSHMLRDTDAIGLGAHNRVLLLLSNTSPEEANFVMKRLSQTGLNIVLLREEAA